MKKFTTEDDPVLATTDVPHFSSEKVRSFFIDLGEEVKHLVINHKHFVQILGKKISFDKEEGYFRWIECSCGLTGTNENGKNMWNESNYCKRLGRTIRK